MNFSRPVIGHRISRSSWVNRYYGDYIQNDHLFPDKNDAQLQSIEHKLEQSLNKLRQSSNFDIRDENDLKNGFRKFYNFREYMSSASLLQWGEKNPIFEKYQLILGRAYLASSLCTIFKYKVIITSCILLLLLLIPTQLLKTNKIWVKYQRMIEQIANIGVQHRPKAVSITLRRQGKSALVSSCLACEVMAMDDTNEFSVLLIPHQLKSGREFLKSTRNLCMLLAEKYGLNVEIGKPNKQTQEMIIKHLDTGCECIIKWVSSNKNAGRSIANWKIIIDEAAFVSDEAFLAGGLSATIEKGKTMFAISTPNPDAASIMDTLTKVCCLFIYFYFLSILNKIKGRQYR